MICRRHLALNRSVLAGLMVVGSMVVTPLAIASVPTKQPVAKPSQVASSAPRPAPQRAATQNASSKQPVAASVPPRAQATASQPQRQSRPVAAAASAPAASAVPVSVSYAERMGLRRVPDPLNLNSSVALVMDAETQEIIVGKNDRAVLPIASLTKLMTGILIADAHLSLNEVITITHADVDRLKNSGSRLAVGTRLTRGQALHLSMMSSENRAAHALARTFPGGIDEFVRLMNEKARSLGMMDTRFADPTGLSPRNQSSARDVAILTAASHQRAVLRDLSTSPSYDLAVGGNRLPYRNSNRLVMNDNWDISLQKTGFIREAGRCVTMKFSIEGRDFIMVLLDSANATARINDAERLRRWMLETNDFGSQQLARAY